MPGLADYLTAVQSDPSYQRGMDTLMGRTNLEKERELRVKEAMGQVEQQNAQMKQAQFVQAAQARSLVAQALADGSISEEDIANVAAADPDTGKQLWSMMIEQRKANRKNIEVNPKTGEWMDINRETGVVSPAQMAGAEAAPVSGDTAAPPMPVASTDLPGSTPLTIPQPPPGLNPAARQTFMEETIKQGVKEGAEEKVKGKAKQGFAKSLNRMRSMIDDLNNMGGMINTDRPDLENLYVAVKQSAAGQMIGKATGDKTQSKRTAIQNYIPVLMRDIKADTGMSAQEVNSIPEMQMLKDSVGNPEVSYQAVQETLANLDEKYGSGKAPPQEGVMMTHPKFGDVTEDDIKETMKANKMTREQVLQKLGGQ